MLFIVDCSIYPIWKLILTADFSVYLVGRTEFDFVFFRLPNLDTRYWLLIFAFEMGLTAGVIGWQGGVIGWQGVWSVDRGCLLLIGTWPYLLCIKRSVCSQFSIFVFHTDLWDCSLFVRVLCYTTDHLLSPLPLLRVLCYTTDHLLSPLPLFLHSHELKADTRSTSKDNCDFNYIWQKSPHGWMGRGVCFEFV
jgi:hypothetical protein